MATKEKIEIAPETIAAAEALRVAIFANNGHELDLSTVILRACNTVRLQVESLTAE